MDEINDGHEMEVKTPFKKDMYFKFVILIFHFESGFS